MPTIITRLYDDKATAQAALDALPEAEHHAFEAEIIPAKSKSAISKKLAKIGLGSRAIDAYAKKAKDKRVLAIISAEFSPDGGTRRLMEILDDYPTVDVGYVDQERFVEEQTGNTRGRILRDTLIMMNPRRRLPDWHIFKGSLISRTPPRVTLPSGNAHFSTRFLPIPLLSKSRERDSTIKGKFLPSSKIGMPMLKSR